MNERMTLRVIARDKDGRIDQVFEQEVPSTDHDIGLWLRCKHVRNAIGHALLKGDTITIVRRR
jgi:hypothetical protein